MKLVIEIDDNHAPFVRQQVDLHGPEVRLDFAHFMALLPGRVIGTLEARDEEVYDGLLGGRTEIRDVVVPLEGS